MGLTLLCWIFFTFILSTLLLKLISPYIYNLQRRSNSIPFKHLRGLGTEMQSAPLRMCVPSIRILPTPLSAHKCNAQQSLEYLTNDHNLSLIGSLLWLFRSFFFLAHCSYLSTPHERRGCQTYYHTMQLKLDKSLRWINMEWWVGTHNVIQIYNNVLWDWQYYAEYSSHSNWFITFVHIPYKVIHPQFQIIAKLHVHLP